MKPPGPTRLSAVLPCLIERREGAVVDGCVLSRLLSLCGAIDGLGLTLSLIHDWGAVRVFYGDVGNGHAWHGIALRDGGIEEARRALSGKYESFLEASGLGLDDDE